MEKQLNLGKANIHYPFTGKLVCGKCGAKLIRHMNTISGIKSPIWVCREHLRHKEQCPMKYVKESSLKGAFATMMNKLIFDSDEILWGLFNNIRQQNTNSNRLRIAEIDAVIGEMTERRQSLSQLANKGYLDAAAFAQETNSIINETEKLKKEKELVVDGADEVRQRKLEMEKLLCFTGRRPMFFDFDGEAFENFVEQVTVVSRTTVTFHMKCGLNLSEVFR